MSYSISTLLTRNLHDVFGEKRPRPSAPAIDEIFTEDCVFYEPRGVYRGPTRSIASRRDQSTHPDFRYQQLPGPRNWAMAGGSMGIGRPGEAPAYAGTDFIIAADGRIAAVLSLFRQAT